MLEKKKKILQPHKKCTDYKVKGATPRGRPKKIWTEVVEKTVQPDN